MGHLIRQGDGTTFLGLSLPPETSLAVTLDDTGTNGLTLELLVLRGTTSVSIASTGALGGFNVLLQLEETNNNLTKVTISGSEPFILGSSTGHSNNGDGVVTDIAATATSPTKMHSSLTLIDASAARGDLEISAGATNTSGAGQFDNGGTLNSNVTITYTGLVIKGGSGSNFIENDAKNGIVTDGNGNFDTIFLGGAGAKAILGTGINDIVFVGASFLGTNETAGAALGDKVTFGDAATAVLTLGVGAEAGSTAGTTSIGLTKVLNAADGMTIHFNAITASNIIVDETQTAAVKSATSITAAENAAVKAMASPGVAYFDFGHNEYFVATNNTETAVSSPDAIVKLVGVTDIHHAVDSAGIVTLHV